MSLIAWLRQKSLARRDVEAEVHLPRPLRMPIVPSSFGLAFFFVLIVMFVWTINHQLNLGYALIFLLAFVALFSAALTVSTFSQLRLRCGEAAPVFAGEDIYFPIAIENEESRPRAAFTLRNAFYQTDCAGIEAHSGTEVKLAQPTAERGWTSLLPLEIYTTMPLGLFVAWQWRHLAGKGLVYPQPAGDLPLPMFADNANGSLMSEGRGEDELVGLQGYHPGDPLSRVAWKQSSRGELLIKQFSGMGAEQVLLDYQKMGGDKETRIAQLTRWVLDAEAAGLLYALRLPNFSSDYSRGQAHYHACLSALAVL